MAVLQATRLNNAFRAAEMVSATGDRVRGLLERALWSAPVFQVGPTLRTIMDAVELGVARGCWKGR